MDPLTHTLVGALLATTRLGRATPLAPAALVIGANLPDVDVAAYAWGSDAALGFRRGWTHGVPALLVLPWLLAGGLLGWDRLVRRRQRAGVPARAAPLLAASAVAVVSHPVLDWLNNYGVRWWMPLDARWSYGDAVFIMDPWLWLALGVPWLLTRRARPAAVTAVLALTLLLAWVVALRAPAYVPVVLGVAGALLAALLVRPPGPERQAAVGTAGLCVAAAYVFSLIALHAGAEARVDRALRARGLEPLRAMVGPVPLDPSSWEVVAEVADGYVHGRYRWRPPQGLSLAGRLPKAAASPLWPQVRAHPDVQGFVRWTRFPWIWVSGTGDGRRVFLLDARYAREPRAGFGGVAVGAHERDREEAARGEQR